MTDWEIVAKKLARIETHVEELRRMANPEMMDRDVKEERFVVHTLQLAAQAAIDTASHIVSDERLGEPRTAAESFEILAKHGWIPDALSLSLRRVVGFRNVVVHGYEVVDLEIVRDVVEHRLGDLLEFVRVVRGWMAAG